jgi:hypothetical protein
MDVGQLKKALEGMDESLIVMHTFSTDGFLGEEITNAVITDSTFMNDDGSKMRVPCLNLSGHHTRPKHIRDITPPKG